MKIGWRRFARPSFWGVVVLTIVLGGGAGVYAIVTDLTDVKNVQPPARLQVAKFQLTTGAITLKTTTFSARFVITDTCNQPVSGALVYVTAVPYNQFSVPNEQQTGSDGWATLEMNRLSGFPATPKQQLLVMFVRARKSGEPTLTGISNRRLISFRVTR